MYILSLSYDEFMLEVLKNQKLFQLLLVIIFISCTVLDDSSVKDTTTESQETLTTTTVAQSTTTTTADTATTESQETTTEPQDTSTEPQETTTESQETMETKLEIPETIKIESEHVNCTIPGFVPEGYKTNYFELSTELDNNKPKKNAENPDICILFSESIPSDFRVYQLDIMQKLIDYVGGYHRWVHIVYEPEDQALEAVDALDKFDFFYDNNHEKVEPTIQFVHDNRSCLSGFGRKQERDLNHFSMCIQPNPQNDPYWENDRNMFGEAFLMGHMNGVAHEYYHHVQRAHVFDLLSDFGPAWYMEGQATVFPSLFMRDNFDDLQIVKDNKLEGSCIGDPEYNFNTVQGKFIKMAGCNLSQKYMFYRQEVTDETDNEQCKGFTNAEESYDRTLCAANGWEMINFYIAYLTSFETLFIKFHEDIYDLGFPETLKKYTGQSFEELYESFNNFILDNPTPPAGFFPEEPLNELVDFWSINSG